MAHKVQPGRPSPGTTEKDMQDILTVTPGLCSYMIYTGHARCAPHVSLDLAEGCLGPTTLSQRAALTTWCQALERHVLLVPRGTSQTCRRAKIISIEKPTCLTRQEDYICPSQQG